MPYNVQRYVNYFLKMQICFFDRQKPYKLYLKMQFIRLIFENGEASVEAVLRL